MTVTADALAKDLKISTRRVQQLAALGMPRQARGAYDLEDCRNWYIAYLRESAQRRPQSREAAARLARIESENTLLGLKIQDRLRSLVSWSRIETLNTETADLIRGALLAIPDQLAPAIAAESDEHKVRALLGDGIRQCLGALARQLRGDASTP